LREGRRHDGEVSTAADAVVASGPAAGGGRSFLLRARAAALVMEREDSMKRRQHSGTSLSGFGLGLRAQHYEEIANGEPAVDWFEIISENYMVGGGRPLAWLDRIGERYPLAMHGVSLSIGSTAPLDRAYLVELKALAKRIEPALISDHLCWTGTGGRNLHDLMPLPHTDEAVRHVVGRVREVQDFLGRQILLENVSSYVDYRHSAVPEWEFLNAVAAEADCLILLDINNIYVNSRNHGFDPLRYLRGVPAERVQQLHLAGHSRSGELLIDTHDRPVPDPVWALYAQALAILGPRPTMIERDDAIPPLADLVAELECARRISADAGGAGT
jgi:uncharacterized protein (UPF0276 family)